MFTEREREHPFTRSPVHRTPNKTKQRPFKWPEQNIEHNSTEQNTEHNTQWAKQNTEHTETTQHLRPVTEQTVQWPSEQKKMHIEQRFLNTEHCSPPVLQ